MHQRCSLDIESSLGNAGSELTYAIADCYTDGANSIDAEHENISTYILVLQPKWEVDTEKPIESFRFG